VDVDSPVLKTKRQYSLEWIEVRLPSLDRALAQQDSIETL